jgi:hypothetical protein
MKTIKKSFALLVLMTLTTAVLFAQEKGTATKAEPKKAEKPLQYKVCNVPVDTGNTRQIALEDAIAWFKTDPIQVLCDGKITVELYQFNIQIITKEPLSTKDYGLGQAGMPILAVNAIKAAKPGDTVFLKNVTYKDPTTREVLKAPNVVFTIK